jgi:hypothetical protein
MSNMVPVKAVPAAKIVFLQGLKTCLRNLYEELPEVAGQRNACPI